jgi:hypothetical protein
MSRMLSLLFLNVLVIVSLTLLVGQGVVSLRGAVIAILLLFGINVVLALVLLRRPTRTGSARLRWFTGALFTLPSIASTIELVREPTLTHGIRVGLALLLAGFAWYIVISFHRIDRNQLSR